MGNAEYKKKHRKLGLCINCSRLAFANGVRCLEHIRTHRKYDISQRGREIDKKRKQSRIIKMKCHTCGKPLDKDADDNFKNCINCREHIWNS